MKLSFVVLLGSCLIVCAETEEQINKQFAVRPGGTVIVDVDFGSIQVSTNASSQVKVDVYRKVNRRSKSDEEAFLKERPVTFSQEGNTLTIQSKGPSRSFFNWRGWQRTEAKYTITVPSEFNAQLKTSGGSVGVNDLTGNVKARTSGGSLNFARLRGPLDGQTSGGSIHAADCEGEVKIHTSGGRIEVAGGSGTLDGTSSGGSVSVKNFKGPAHVETSGGGINLENVAGKVDGSTSGGSISARFGAPISDEVRLQTSGGGVTVQVADSSAFDLDAGTSGGRVSSELPVTVVGDISKTRIKGTVNGGGKPVFLRTSGGSIHVKKL
ncbi:MAG TPA: DUF4097 family beta strand repeat-containing protein [Clostridia bacterium]|nr:DUF4097 family beta strand repeat-containing protein [Clostridia bacterium]